MAEAGAVEGPPLPDVEDLSSFGEQPTRSARTRLIRKVFMNAPSVGFRGSSSPAPRGVVNQIEQSLQEVIRGPPGFVVLAQSKDHRIMGLDTGRGRLTLASGND